ncbi:MAG: aldehyde dehydrogenase family protein [Actinomycetota bacterium]
MDRTSHYIGGAWLASSSADRIDVLDPGTEQVIGQVPAGTAEDAGRAVSAARAAFATWATTAAKDRTDLIARLLSVLTERADEVAATITAEMGCPPRIARGVQVGTPLSVIEGYLALLPEFEWEERIGNSLVVKEPIGVVAAITPWNYPLHQVVSKIVPALAAGCTVVLKPSEVAPLTAFLLADMLHEIGVPPGVFNLVSGTGAVVGAALAAHPDVDMVSFTGSTRAGKEVAALAAGTVKRVALELGGKSANVLLDDADFARAVKVGVGNAFLNSGQTCTAWTRLVVPRARQDEVAAAAASLAQSLSSKLGPVVSQEQFDRVQSYISAGVESGAVLVAGGLGRPDGVAAGYYVRPTVFADVTSAMAIAQEEIFGPVLAILPYDDEAEALEIANSTSYGLAGAVWSADVDRAIAFARSMQTGQVDINGAAFNPLAPFGGVKQSGVGRELGRYGLEEFLVTKSIQL